MTSEELRQKRDKMGLSQDTLARLMGMPNTEGRSISRLETGARAPTNKDVAAVKNIEFIFENGLLHKLLEK